MATKEAPYIANLGICQLVFARVLSQFSANPFGASGTISLLLPLTKPSK